jgi:hypothetical protein
MNRLRLCLYKLKIIHKLKEDEEFKESIFQYALENNCENMSLFLDTYDFSAELKDIWSWG